MNSNVSVPYILCLFPCANSPNIFLSGPLRRRSKVWRFPVSSKIRLASGCKCVAWIECIGNGMGWGDSWFLFRRWLIVILLCFSTLLVSWSRAVYEIRFDDCLGGSGFGAGKTVFDTHYILWSDWCWRDREWLWCWSRKWRWHIWWTRVRILCSHRKWRH